MPARSFTTPAYARAGSCSPPRADCAPVPPKALPRTPNRTELPDRHDILPRGRQGWGRKGGRSRLERGLTLPLTWPRAGCRFPVNGSGSSSAWIERCVRDAEAAGSNPVSPTKRSATKPALRGSFLFSYILPEGHGSQNGVHLGDPSRDKPTHQRTFSPGTG